MAAAIQAVVRGGKVRLAIKALSKEKASQRKEEEIREKYEHETPQEHAQSEDAALRIQKVYRGHHNRDEVKELRVEVRTTTRAKTRTRSINEREVLRQINDYQVSAAAPFTPLPSHPHFTPSLHTSPFTTTR